MGIIRSHKSGLKSSPSSLLPSQLYFSRSFQAILLRYTRENWGIKLRYPGLLTDPLLCPAAVSSNLAETQGSVRWRWALISRVVYLYPKHFLYMRDGNYTSTKDVFNNHPVATRTTSHPRWSFTNSLWNSKLETKGWGQKPMEGRGRGPWPVVIYHRHDDLWWW